MTEQPAQPTVTRGTAIGATVGGSVTLAQLQDAFQWWWAGDYTQLAGSVAQLFAIAALAVVGLLSTLVYWWLSKKGIPTPPKLGKIDQFPTAKDDGE